MQEIGYRVCGAPFVTGARVSAPTFVLVFLHIALHHCIWFSLCADIFPEDEVLWSKREGDVKEGNRIGHLSRIDDDDRRMGVRAFDSVPPPGIIHPEKRELVKVAIRNVYIRGKVVPVS